MKKEKKVNFLGAYSIQSSDLHITTKLIIRITQEILLILPFLMKKMRH